MSGVDSSSPSTPPPPPSAPGPSSPISDEAPPVPTSAMDLAAPPAIVVDHNQPPPSAPGSSASPSLPSGSHPPTPFHAPPLLPSPASKERAEQSRELRVLHDKMEGMAAKGNWSELADLVRGSEKVWTNNQAMVDEFLISLNPAHCTIAIVHCLSTIFDYSQSKKSDAGMMKSAAIFKSFVENRSLVREQVLVVIDVYVSFFNKLTAYLIKKEEFVNGIPFLRSGIDVIVDPQDQTVTSLHGCLFCLCLKAHAIGPGLEYVYPYIRELLEEHNPRNPIAQNNTVESRGLLTYLYYGGLLAARAGDWKRATSLLEKTAIVPGISISQIQIDAFKKLVIIGHIAYGNYTLPTRTPALAKAWKAHAVPYTTLAMELGRKDCQLNGGERREVEEGGGGQIGMSMDTNRDCTLGDVADKAEIVAKISHTYVKQFKKDQNMDLLLILIQEFKLRSVLRVAKLYSVVSLKRMTELAHLADIGETKKLVTSLVSRGRLLAQEEPDGYIRLSIPTAVIYQNDITARQQRLVKVTEDLKRLDVQAQKTVTYVVRTSKGGFHPHDDEGLSMSNTGEHPWVPTGAPSSVPISN